jgi:Rod binding domain-containing protein
MGAVSLQLDQRVSGAKPQTLRRACNELVGLMFGQLLKDARQSKLARGLTDSSAGRMFQGQLDEVLIQSAARGDRGTGVFSAISDGIYRQLGGAASVAQPPSAVQARGKVAQPASAVQKRMDVKG